MTREEQNFIGAMNMCDEISNEAYKKIMCHCEEQEPCEDAISRQAVIDYINRILNQGTGKKKSFEFIQKYVEKLPPVNPHPKTGHWIEVDTNMYSCSSCNHCFTIVPEDNSIKQFKYCPNCNAKMVEPQKSEE